MKLLILADDFTGAMDTGVQLSKAHIQTLVFSKLPDRKEKENLPFCQVLVLHTNLRHEAPSQAYQVISDLLAAYYEPGVSVYMKTDSALRGNISATLAAAVDTLHMPLHFIPAFPDADRTVKNGIVYISGMLLEDSVFRNDPRSPMTESDLMKIVTKDYPLSCRLISSTSSGFTALREEFSTISKSGVSESDVCESAAFDRLSPQLYLYDASTNDDLASIGAFLKEQNALTLTAGCAGFAAQFPNYLDFPREAPYTPDTPGPLLFLSGSANAITFRQLAKAKEMGYPLLPMKPYLEASIKGDLFCKELEDKLVENAITFLREGKSVILATAQDAATLLDFPALMAFAESEEAIHAAISDCSCRLVRRILEAVDISCLTVFGGDTVAGILDELGCSYVYAKGEIDTGVPLCQLTYRLSPERPAKTLHLVTKSGGLGCETIVKSIDKYFNSL